MSRARNARTSCGISGSKVYVRDLPPRASVPIERDNNNATPAKQRIAVRAEKPSFSPDAATISGDGVSPAASAAAIGSPPGSAIAIFSADEGIQNRVARRQ